MDGIDTVRDLTEMSNYFSVNPSNRHALLAFKEQYLCELREQLSSPFTKEEELYRTMWLDAVRWMVAYRMMLFFRTLTPDFKSRILRVLSPVYLLIKYDPWCNFVMAFGGSCDSCPLVEYELVDWVEGISPIGESNFLRCDLRNPLRRNQLQMFRREDYVGFFSYARQEIDDGVMVRLWRKRGNDD